MKSSSLETKVEKYVKGLFKNLSHDQLHYHNIEHTETVVNRVELATSEKHIKDDEKGKIIIAAWFHDIGYLYQYDNHEEKSIEICKEFLMNENVNTKTIDEICEMIYSTNLEAEPNNQLAALLKDIDIAYALYTDFKEKGDLLKLEKEIQLKKTINDKEWNNSQIDFLNKIKFYSTYGERNFSEILEATKRMQV